MQKQLKVSVSPYKDCVAQDLRQRTATPSLVNPHGGFPPGNAPTPISYGNLEYPGEGVIAPEAPSRSDPAGFDPSLDLPKNNCKKPETTSKIQKALPYCPTSPGHFKHADGRVRLAPCKNWACPFCAPKKKVWLLHRLAQGGARGGYRWRLLTLTQHPDDPTYIMHAWARFRAYLAFHGKRHLKFAWAKEFTKKGVRHLHAVINAYIPHSLLKAAWMHATSGHSWIVDIRMKDDVHSVGGYMGKYITKTLECDHDWARHERRFGFSQWAGWTIITMPEPGWTFIYEPVLRVGQTYLDMGLITEMQTRKRKHESLAQHVRDLRVFTTALQDSISDSLQSVVGIPIDKFPWDDRGRLYISTG